MQFLHKAELVKLDFTTTVNPNFAEKGFQRKYKCMVRFIMSWKGKSYKFQVIISRITLIL